MKTTMSFVLLMLSATSLRSQIAEPAAALTIYTRFATPPSSPSVGYMKSELDAVMFPFHLRIEWVSLERANGREAAARVMVVSFRGACHVDSLPAVGPASGRLGWTQVAAGEILPFSDVDCDEIRSLLTARLALSLPEARERLLGCAMARVLAHELYHYLTGTTKHASSGIAKAFYTGAELASSRLRFDEAQLRSARGF